MRKILVSAILLSGIGIATSKADATFGIIAGRTGYSQAGYGPPAPVYAQPAYPGDPHRALHRDLGDVHGDVHRSLKDARRDLEQDIRRAREALHRQLEQERAYGVPAWQRKAKHDAAHDAFKQWRRDGERQLQAQHGAAHYDLRNEHRDSHDALRW